MDMLKSLFLPATLLMNKLRFHLKFTLIMLLFLLPLGILTYNYFSEVIRISKHSENELQGVLSLQQLSDKQSELAKMVAYELGWRSAQAKPQAQVNRVSAFNDNLNSLASAEVYSEDELKTIQAALDRLSNTIDQRAADLGNAQWTPIDRYNNLLGQYLGGRCHV